MTGRLEDQARWSDKLIPGWYSTGVRIAVGLLTANGHGCLNREMTGGEPALFTHDSLSGGRSALFLSRTGIHVYDFRGNVILARVKPVHSNWGRHRCISGYLIECRYELCSYFLSRG